MIRRALRRFARREQGFTMIELVVGMPILLLIGAALTLTLTSSSNFSHEAQQATSLQLEARMALTTLASDFRQAYTGNPSLSRVESIGPVLTFYSPDRRTPMHLRRISYRFSNGTLMRSLTISTNTNPQAWTWPAVAGPWTPEVSSLTSVTFSAYDSKAPPQGTTDPTQVKSLVVSLTGSTSGSTKRTYSFQTTTEIRQA